MNDYTLSVYGTAQLLARLQSLADFWSSTELQTLLEDTKNSLIRLARKAVPKKSRLLSRKIDGIVENFGSNNPRVRFGIMNLNEAKYAKYIEEGAPPHSIMPRTKKWLRWTTKGPRGERVSTPPGIVADPGLTQVFRKHVFHPGNKPQPFIGPQINIIRPRFLKALARVLQAKLSGQGGSTA